MFTTATQGIEGVEVDGARGQAQALGEGDDRLELGTWAVKQLDRARGLVAQRGLDGMTTDHAQLRRQRRARG